MTRLRGKRIGVILILALLGPGALLHSQEADEQSTRAELERLEGEIQRITQAQRAREKQRGEVHGELRRSEQRLNTLAKELANTRQAIATTEKKLRDLAARQGELEAAADAQGVAVRNEIRRAYESGGSDQLRLLLNEEDPQALARMLAYYRYFLRARTAIIDEYRATQAELKEIATDLQRQSDTLRERRQDFETQQANVEGERKERQALLKRIEAEWVSDAAALEQRQQDRTQLEKLLAEIEDARLQLMPQEAVEPFSKARGSLPWPVQGTITQRFGRPRNQGKMRWQGVRLKAEAGALVAAVHHGRVVYADWLRGSGLLLVIDHGEGYMSLYAHNESLLREVGDWVTAGAPVATVGDSGGQTEPGLYFEIRKDGKPTDPQRWCRG